MCDCVSVQIHGQGAVYRETEAQREAEERDPPVELLPAAARSPTQLLPESSLKTPGAMATEYIKPTARRARVGLMVMLDPSMCGEWLTITCKRGLTVEYHAEYAVHINGICNHNIFLTHSLDTLTQQKLTHTHTESQFAQDTVTQHTHIFSTLEKHLTRVR